MFVASMSQTVLTTKFVVSTVYFIRPSSVTLGKVAQHSVTRYTSDVFVPSVVGAADGAQCQSDPDGR